jgi:hypothetical protein
MIQTTRFPAASAAVALTSANRYLVVEPGVKGDFRETVTDV